MLQQSQGAGLTNSPTRLANMVAAWV